MAARRQGDQPRLGLLVDMAMADVCRVPDAVRIPATSGGLGVGGRAGRGGSGLRYRGVRGPAGDRDVNVRLFDFLCRLWVAAMFLLFAVMYLAAAASCLLGGGAKAHDWWERFF